MNASLDLRRDLFEELAVRATHALTAVSGENLVLLNDRSRQRWISPNSNLQLDVIGQERHAELLEPGRPIDLLHLLR